MTTQQEQKHLRLQLEAQGITDRRVLDAIEQTRRDLFVPEEFRNRAYENNALPIGEGQTISQPFMVAIMTQELALTGTEKVLEIGTGSGYQSAILAQLCAEVVTIERIDELSQPAQKMIAELEFHNIEFQIGDGTLGCPELAPFDGIIVTAAAPHIPDPLYEQLKPGGRLVIPVGDESLQTLQVVVKREPQARTYNVCECRFVKLIGQAGWQEQSGSS